MIAGNYLFSQTLLWLLDLLIECSDRYYRNLKFNLFGLCLVSFSVSLQLSQLVNGNFGSS